MQSPKRTQKGVRASDSAPLDCESSRGRQFHTTGRQNIVKQ